MSKASIDAIDRKILQHLIRNARMPFLEIARECGISGAAIHQRVKKLDEMGVILGSRLEVDPKKLGFDVCALIGIRVSDPSRYENTVETLKQIPEVVECHFITGEYNMMLKVYCLNNEHLMQILSKDTHHRRRAQDRNIHLARAVVQPPDRCQIPRITP